MTTNQGLRWNDYVFASSTDLSLQLLGDATSDRRTLLICGAGFDPRTADAPTVIESLKIANLDVIAVQPGPSGEHEDAATSAATNIAALRTLFGARLVVVPEPDALDIAAAGPLLTRSLIKDHDILAFDTVIVDMSGLPSAISFVLLHLFLDAWRDVPKNLLVTVSDDSSTDARIRAAGLGDPSILNALTRRPAKAQNIWIPVLGPDAGGELQALRVMLDPQDVFPVVPFPAVEPRRGDELLVEHRVFLFEEVKFEPRNVMYASESNPFDLYRQLVSLATRYRMALAPLGKVAIVASEHASKLLSLGVLLAAHEAGIAVAQVAPLSYTLLPETVPHDREPVLRTAWLTGEPYDVGGSNENGRSDLQ